MPHFSPRLAPIMARLEPTTAAKRSAHRTSEASSQTPERIRVKNRRKRYLDCHPDYFDASLELANPLMYDSLIRRFQTPAEREAEGRKKGYSGVLEADMLRSEAKLHALDHPDPNLTLSYRRGPDGEIIGEEKEDGPRDKEEGMRRWRYEMERRFLRGEDNDFEYETVDHNEEYDDVVEEERDAQDEYFKEEEPTWLLDDGKLPEGETGVQDY